MPTPDESTLLPPSPPPETSSSRASLSCPPEEEREIHAPREARISTPSPVPSDLPAVEREDDGHMTFQAPTPEPEARGVSPASPPADPDADTKIAQAKDAGIAAVDAPTCSTRSPDLSSEVGPSGAPSAQTLATVDADQKKEEEEEEEEEDEEKKKKAAGDAPLYLWYPPINRERRQPHSTSSFLRPGSKFRGTQQSDRQVYDVQVEIKDVDLAESFLCGYLRIQGLTDDHPTLTTFFEGEIIGPKHLFRTTHPSWNSSEKIDLQHWARFPPFRPLARAAKANPATFTLRHHLDREHIFMRWKEYFLVPDHRVKSISGASFEGFYYICFDQRAGGVSGIYFHAKSEKFQQLELRHVHDGGCMGSVEFR